MVLRSEDIPTLVDTKRAAEILGRSAATVKRWRYEGVGPQYISIERHVRYDVRVLLDFLKGSTRVPSVRAYVEDSRGAL